MEYVIFAVVIVLFIIGLMIKGYIDYRKELKNFKEKRYKDYGLIPKREYKAEQFSNISKYFLKHREGFYIDDITWNDLNMDEVFKSMNDTYSAAGEEYLYYTLRTPSFNVKELNRKEEIISFFQTHADERVTCQLLFKKLGRTGKFSIYDYLDYLDSLGKRSNGKHYLALIMVILAIGVIFVNLPLGLLLLVMVLVINILTYFKVKSEIDPYITSFSYIFKLLDMSSELSKVALPILKDEMEELKNTAKRFSGFKRGSYLLMSSGRMSASGNPIEIVLDYLRMAWHLDLIQFNRMLGEVRKHIDGIDTMLTIVGKIEAMIAIGAFRESKTAHCIPVFTQAKGISAEEVYHPLLKEPVKNRIATQRSVLITGSNASGKSTFLKTVALNQILAQTINTCMANAYVTTFFRVSSSMALRDDIRGGDSYYMVEIKALKRIMDELKMPGAPVLCFVDEVLRGTNTVERIAASVQILQSLCRGNCLCFAATHDIELTHLLDKEYENYHFEEQIQDDDIAFSYKIMEGRAQSRNAIRLLGIMGYEEELIKKAEEMAADFIRTGSWNENV